MPELPEVETMRRGIAGIVGARVTAVPAVRCRLQPIRVTPPLPTFRRCVVGCTVEGLGRLGKRLLLHLSGDQAIVFEPRMTGLVLLTDPPSREHLRFRLELEGAAAPSLWFWDRRGLGSVRLWKHRELEQELGPRRLGPDALIINSRQLRERLQYRHTPIKVALLDQTALAGVGNLYASEILHVARIDPRATCDQLDGRQWGRLVRSMHAVLNEAIRYEGSTLADGTYRTALNNPGGYQNRHRVYSRTDEPCPRCRSCRIVRIVQAQRSTFYCPGCQRQ